MAFEYTATINELTDQSLKAKAQAQQAEEILAQVVAFNLDAETRVTITHEDDGSVSVTLPGDKTTIIPAK